MPLLYNLIEGKDGSYSFTTEDEQRYVVVFFENFLLDEDGNEHVVFNFVFTRDNEFVVKPFVFKYDEKIKDTILFIIEQFFVKNGHRALLYYCFGDDGYARHRKITFKKWSIELDAGLESYDRTINYLDNEIYGSLVIKADNPLKKLIVNAFDASIRDIDNY